MAWTAPKTWVVSEALGAAELNTHVRDNLEAGFPTDAVYTAWSPSYANLTIGNGTVTARYIQIGKLVVCHFMFTLGSTSAVGTNPTISPPVTVASSYLLFKNVLGRCWLEDTPGTDYLGIIRANSTTTLLLLVEQANATYLKTASVTATVPFTWATGDVIVFSAAYEAA